MNKFTEVKLRNGESVWIEMTSTELEGLINLAKDGIVFDETLNASKDFKDIEVKISEITAVV